MSPFEMGRVSAFLLKHRRVEEKSDRRSIQKEERDIAELLREAPLDSLQFLEELVGGYGFELIALTSFEIQGIPPGAKVSLLVRRSNSECILLDANRLVERMTSDKKAGAAKVWFTQIWLMHLDLMYTVRDRGPHERGRWLEAIFTEDQLAEAISEHINGYVRRLNPAEVEQSEVYQVLMSEKGQDRARYVKRFLAIMVDAGMLDVLGSGTYRQSLLSSVEMKCNFDRILAPMMLDLPSDPEVIGLAHQAAEFLTAKLSSDVNEGVST
jgi:hypothetical protein